MFVFVFLLSSCRVTRQESQKTDHLEIVVSESKTTYKDTTLFAPRAETSLKISLSELAFKDSLNSFSKPIIYSQKNGHANVKIKVVRDTIEVSAECDSLAIVAKIRSESNSLFQLAQTSHTSATKKSKKFGFLDLVLVFLAGTVVGFLFSFIIKKPLK